jgi:RNA polymerase sigma factor (sigma-70 family)
VGFGSLHAPDVTVGKCPSFDGLHPNRPTFHGKNTFLPYSWENFMQPSDTALIEASRNGDSHAWQQLVERYQRLIYTIPRRAGFDESHAGEIFQRVFAKLVANIHRIEQPERIQAWLVTTAKRETLRMVDKEKRFATTSHDLSEQESLPDTLTPVPDEVVEQLEEQNQVRLAVEQIGDKCRRLLTLLFYQSEPLAYSDIAHELGIAEGSIGPTRARCLQKVQKVLLQNGFFACILAGVFGSVWL